MALASTLIPVTSSAADEFARPFELLADDDALEWDFKARYYYPGKATGGPVLDSIHAGQRMGRLPLGSLIHYGCKPLRLYGGTTTALPEVRALNPLISPLKGAEFTITRGLSIAPMETHRGYDQQQVVAMGLGSDKRVESLQFAGTTEQATRFGALPGATTPALLHVSNFIDASGNPVAQPVAAKNGQFVADQPVYGALLVGYTVPYRRYRVYYDVPAPAWNVQLFVNNKILAYDDLVDAPQMTLVAIAGGQITTLEIAREYGLPNVQWNREDNAEPDRTLVEDVGKRRTVTKTIVDENNPDSSVDIEQLTEVSLIDDKGTRMTLKMADLP